MGFGSTLKTIFSPVGKVVGWLTKDDENLRAARARALGGPEIGEPGDAAEDKPGQKSEQERLAEQYNVWEEIDSMRMSFWFGGKFGRYMARDRSKELKEKLERLEQKRAEERKKKEAEG